MKLKDLKPNPKNPRTITEERLDALGKSLERFGDMGGFVYNTRSKQLEGAHQRQKYMPPDCEIVIEKTYDPPTKTGTVAEGYVDFKGEHHKYRAVDWDKSTAMAANLAANKHGGDWDMTLLPNYFHELSLADVDLNLTGFMPDEISVIIGPAPEPPPSGPSPTMRDKFIVPPFSVLDARQGYWQDRKRQWIALGIESELGRGEGERERERERAASFKNQEQLAQYRRTKKPC